METGGAPADKQDAAGSGGAPATAAPAKKSAYENLDKSELIAKCKGLLQLARSAKQTKDEYAAENARLKESLDAIQQQRSGDKDNLRTLQASLHKLNDTVATLEEQKLLDKTYMKGMHEMVDELTNEKDTLARRVSRLTQDNDALLRDCRQSDAILRQLNDSMAEHQQQVQQLQAMCAQQKEQNTELRAKHANEVGVAQRAEEHRRTLHDRCQSHEGKLRLYRTKLVDFAAQLKQMRVCKEVLHSTVREYSQAVCQWQGDILNVSNEFFTRNRELAAQNAELQQRIAGLEEQLANGNQPVESADDGREQQQQHCTALLQLDSSLATIAAESTQLLQRHQTERALLESECEALRSSLTNETEQRDATIAALQLQHAKVAEQLRLAGDTAQLVVERNSLIEKGQHLVEMVGELQQNATEMRAQLLQQTEKEVNDQLVIDGLRGELNVAAERRRELESNQGQLDNSVQAVLEQAAHIESLQSELAVRSSVAEQRQTELVACQQSLLDMENIRSELNDRIGQFEQQRSQTIEQIADLQNQLTASQSQDDTVQVELVACKHELEQSSEHIKTLQQNIEQLKQTSEQHHQALRSQMTGDNQSTAELVASLRSELEVCKSEYAQLQATGSRDQQLLAEELKTLSADLELVQNKFVNCQQDLDKLKETSEHERQAMEEQLVASKKILEHYESTLKLVESQRSELKDRKSEFEQFQETSSRDQQALQDEVINLKATVEKGETTAELIELLQQKLNDRQQDLETLKESSKKSAEQLKQSKSNSEQVESLLVQLEKSKNEFDTLQQDHHSTLVLQEELQKELSNHKSTLQLVESLRSELEDSKRVFDQLQDSSKREQQALQHQLTTVQESLKNGEETSQVVEALRSELVEHQRDIERLQYTNRQQLENLSQSAELVDLGQQNLATERLASQTLREEIAALRVNELQPLTSDLHSNQQKLNEIESLRAELLECNHALRDQVAVLQAELTQREEALSRAQFVQSDRAELLGQIDASRQETAALNELLEAVRCDLDERDSSLACKSREMDEMLSEMRELNDALRNRGDVISKQEQQIEALAADSQQSKSIADELSASRLIIAELKTNAATDSQQSKSIADELSASRLIIAELKSNAATDQKQRSAAEAEVQQLTALRSELSASQAQRSEIESELEPLRTKHAATVDELQKLAAELKRTKTSLKKTNVLSLEIEAQEKSLIDISQKLDAKSGALDELQQQNHQLDETIAGLKQQIRSMEDTLRAENEHSAELKTQIDAQQANLKLAESRAADAQRQLDDAHRQSAAIDDELCDLRSANAQSADQLQQTNSALLAEQQQLQQRLRGADEAAAEWRTRHTAAGEELDAVRTEFVAYKVRAQSQLRATQQLESSRECELEEELAAVRATTAALGTKLAAAQLRAQQLDATVAEQRAEAQRQREQVQQLLRVAEEARQTAEAGQADLRLAQREHQEALRGQRLQTDTLAASFKQEVQALQGQLEEQKRLQLQQLQLQQQQQKIESTTSTTSTAQQASKQSRPSANDDQQRLDWILSASDRPAVEGSESTHTLQQPTGGTAYHHQQPQHQQRRRLSTANSSSGRSHRDLMPLDELLNASFESTTESGAAGAFDDDEYEAAVSSAFDAPAARQRLQVQETRVKHLTTLLAESEQDTARLTQLNDALKEELRRQERSAEREQHLHNLEYLKNVLFKFLTIQQGNEKAHLVTVLNTMLKLSPEETQKLQAVASGTDARQRGWGRYLPL